MITFGGVNINFCIFCIEDIWFNHTVYRRSVKLKITGDILKNKHQILGYLNEFIAD
jgi:hypothetical protein